MFKVSKMKNRFNNEKIKTVPGGVEVCFSQTYLFEDHFNVEDEAENIIALCCKFNQLWYHSVMVYRHYNRVYYNEEGYCVLKRPLVY